MTKRFILALLFSCSPLWATTYYVDNCVTVGNDRNNGASTSTPWLTINKVNTSKFNPGDSILFESTCTWREQLTVPSSGSAGSPITFGAYGTGAAPIISGANLFTSWTLSSGSIYYTSYLTAPNQVFEDGSRLTQNTVSAASLTAGQWYLDTANSRIWVQLTASDNPSGHTMEASQRDYGIYGYGSGSSDPYVTISGVETDKANQVGIAWGLGSNGLIITGVTALLNFADGIGFANCPSATVSYSTAAYNGQDGFHSDWSSGVLFDHVVGHDNAQLAPTTTGSPQAGVYLFGYGASPNATVQYSKFYNNGILGSGGSGVGIWADTIGSGFTAKFNYVCNNNLEGIRAEANTSISILNNVVCGTITQGGWSWAAIDLAADNVSYTMSNSLVAGNTVYGNTGVGLSVNGPGIAGGCVNNTVENNIVVGNSQQQFDAFSGCDNPGTNGSGNVYTHNDFGTAASNFIEWGMGTYYSTYSAWETATGNCGTTGCSNSVQSAPTFANASAGQFWLTSGSPGIGAGVNLGSPYNVGLLPGSTWPTGVTTGPTNTPPDIGAFVYVPPVALNPPSNLQAVVH